MQTEILPIDDADRTRIQAALDRYTAAIASAPDPTYWSPKQDVPYVFDGSVEDINVLCGIQYDGPGDRYDGTGWQSTERDALIWANAIERNTPLEWGKLASGELCIWCDGYPRMLAVPYFRFFEAERAFLSSAVNGMTAALVHARFIFDCLLNEFDEEDIRPLFTVLEEGHYESIVAAVKTYPVS